jgi:acyl dehydratase
MAMLAITSLDELQSLAGKGPVAWSEWTLLSQEKITSFADVSGDRQWIHVDSERSSRESPFGAPVAHGFLTLSLISRMAGEAFSIRLGDADAVLVNYGLNRVRFPAPVHAGKQVRGAFALLGCGPRPGGIEMIWQVTIQAEGESKPACVAEWVLVLLPVTAV